MRQVLEPVQLDFDRDGNLLFYFFGGAAGPLRNDLDVIVSHVRVSFDRKVVEGDCSPNEQEHG